MPAREALTITATGGEPLVELEITTFCAGGTRPLVEVEGLGDAVADENGCSDSVNVLTSINVVVRPLVVKYRV